MDIDSFVEKMKGRTLYEARSADALPNDILDLGRSRVNEQIAKTTAPIMDICSTWPEGLAQYFEDAVHRLRSTFGAMDGWAVKQAITAEGQKALREQEEQKKGGILGWLR